MLKILALLLSLLINIIPALPAFSASAAVEAPNPACSLISLTDAERAYIAKAPPVRVVFVDGVAPISYFDGRGYPQGIALEVAKIVSERSGLRFDIQHSKSLTVADINKMTPADFDVIACVAVQYGNLMNVRHSSIPYLRSKTVLCFRSGIQNPTDLSQYIFASLTKKQLPTGVNPDKIKLYRTREDSLNAIEAGRADYTFANEFSVAYYTIKNGLYKIKTIPQKMEGRQYSFGLINDDPVMLSVINKAIASISPEEMQSIIFSAAGEIDPDLSFGAVLKSYGKEAAIGASLFIVLLSFFAFMAVKDAVAYRGKSRQYLWLAEHDGMTGLYNNSAMRRKCGAMFTGEADGTQKTLLVCDIDSFKAINDNYGHDVGDEALKIFSLSMRNALEPYNAIIARMGGDEFSALIPRLMTEEEISAVYGKIISSAAEKVQDRFDFPLSASMGFMSVDTPLTFDEAYRRADSALYEAKRDGKSHYVIFGKR